MFYYLDTQLVVSGAKSKTKKSPNIIQVKATDADKGVFGAIRYTALSGKLADRLQLDTYSGLISCASNNRDLDREQYEGIQLSL